MIDFHDGIKQQSAHQTTFARPVADWADVAAIDECAYFMDAPSVSPAGSTIRVEAPAHFSIGDFAASSRAYCRA